MRMDEDEILREYAILKRSGQDPKAFGVLYEKYFNRIFYFIYRQVDDEDVTADLCSQTFLTVLNHSNRYQYRGVPLSAWFYKIARNQIYQYYRVRNRTRVFSFEEERIRELFEQENTGWNEKLIDRLLKYLDELPTDMLEVLQLRFYENKSFLEIAFILDITVSGAKMRTHRALDQLRKKFNLKIRYNAPK